MHNVLPICPNSLSPLRAGWWQTRQYTLAVLSGSNGTQVAVPFVGISSYKSLSGSGPTAGSAVSY